MQKQVRSRADCSDRVTCELLWLNIAWTIHRAPLRDKHQVDPVSNILLHLKVVQKSPRCAVKDIKWDKYIDSR